MKDNVQNGSNSRKGSSAKSSSRIPRTFAPRKRPNYGLPKGKTPQTNGATKSQPDGGEVALKKTKPLDQWRGCPVRRTAARDVPGGLRQSDHLGICGVVWSRSGDGEAGVLIFTFQVLRGEHPDTSGFGLR